MLKDKGPEHATPFYYQLDHLGTPQELTACSGAIMWSAQYKAYGNVARLEVAEIDNPLRFQGQYCDAETGLHYNRHRYYNPNTARYLTPDPIKLAGGLNNYRYVPNPTGWVDPLGLSCATSTCLGTASEASASDNSSEVTSPSPEATKPDFYVGPSGPESTMPSTGYRYMRYTNDDASVNKYADMTIRI